MEKKRRKLLPSPAMIVAIVALIVALVGTAFASGVLSKKKVNKIITNRARGLTVANAEKLGGQPPGSYQQRVRWALVKSDGTILAQSGGITDDLHNPNGCSGCDFLNFGASQTGKAIVVTPSDPIRALWAQVCGAYGYSCAAYGVSDDTTHIVVRSAVSSSTMAINSTYYVAVID
jgi:hypothetical protein